MFLQRRKTAAAITLHHEEKAMPVCPWCESSLDTVAYRRMYGGLWGKRHIYFCPSCSKVLGTSHRAFWLG